MLYSFVLKTVAVFIFSFALISCRASGDDGGDGQSAVYFIENIIARDEAGKDVGSRISVSPSRCLPETPVTILVTNSSSSYLDSLFVEDAKTEIRPQTCSSSPPGTRKYVFYMPKNNVTIQASFKDTASDDADLASVNSPQGNIIKYETTPSAPAPFEAGHTEYILEVSPLTKEVDFSWTTSHIGAQAEFKTSRATIYYGGEDSHGFLKTESDTPSNSIFLVSIEVTPQTGDQNDKRKYDILVIKKPDLNIDSIYVKKGAPAQTLVTIYNPVIAGDEPVILPAIPPYSNLGSGQDEVNLHLLPVSEYATISGTDDYSGSWSGLPSEKVISIGDIAEGDSVGDNDSRVVISGERHYNNAGHPFAGSSSFTKTYEKKYKIILKRPLAGTPSSEMVECDSAVTQFVEVSAGVWDEVHIFTVRANKPYESKKFGLIVRRIPEGKIRLLLIGGGGGGGASGSVEHPGSGGGAGGVLFDENVKLELTRGMASELIVGGAGYGGKAFNYQNTTTQVSGGDSEFKCQSGRLLIAKGGGAGGWHEGGNGGRGASGGSGGGGYGGSSLNLIIGAGVGFEGQGNSGGLHGDYGAGGGGGYSAPGIASYKAYGISNNSIQSKSDGGAGFDKDASFIRDMLEGIAGIPVEFAGGGAGGEESARATHGGGARFDDNGQRDPNGISNTGGGGAGGYNGAGYSGGSGIAILRFRYKPPATI
jgi:hypothetical protein